MNPTQVRNDLQNAFDLFAEKGIALICQQITDERESKYRRITWRQSSETISKPQFFGTVEQYLSILKDNSFSCLLFDGSILRTSYSYHRNDLIAHNLWYYPCPFEFPRDELLTEPLGDLIDIYSEAGTEYFRLRGPIRFDYDVMRAEELEHPSVHAHFINDDCRIPVKRPLSPGTFFKFIFFNFYKELWNSFSFLRELPEDTFNQTILPNEEKFIHFSWNPGEIRVKPRY
ncbi:MAG: DUF2290 domain-containing protein [Desulfobacteraceae bacterium]|nr:DUF2290 domain-containing protein [Desulfobacteraceae bacterium]